MDLLGLFVILVLSISECFCLQSPNKPSLPEYREAYFTSANSSSMRMWYTVTLHHHIGISFRTCVGGELFSQRYKGYSFQLSALSDNVMFTVKWVDRPRVDVRLPLRPLDNRWHYVGLMYRAPELTLSDESGHSVVVANATYNPEILTTPELEAEEGILQVGNMYSGCLMEGPGLVFNMSLLHPRNVVFGRCPLSTEKCVERRDVLTSPPIDHCYHEPCMRHGICISRQDRYECHCTARYSGNNCQIDNGPPCESAPCQNGGRCDETKIGDYICTCAAGYYGDNCEYEVHPLCSVNPCLNNGTCRVPANTETYQCTCTPGFTGANCELNVDDCLTAPQPPCQNGGICQDALNNYTCICTNTGYTGARCEININECELQPGPCLNHGVCFDTYGSYVCQCQPGYAGNNCQLNQNECLSSPCLNGGTCTDLVGSYECLCPPGVGGVRCGQVQGLVRSRGARCIDLTDCPPHSQCDDGHHCVCQPPYTGVPGNCTLISGFECPTNPCKNGGTCIYDKVFDIISCTCPPGYTGTYCELPFQQSLANIAIGNTVNSYTSQLTSSAPTAYSLSDVFMGGNAALCSRLPCKHASSCHQYPGGFYCKCEPGWTGVTCETDINECLSQPCLNGGECTQLINNFHCRCPLGYTGKLCQTIIDPCLSRPCKNNGECFARPNSTEFSCKCPTGFEGHLCETNIDDCVHVTCPEHQVCYDGINSYMCRCPDGFTGENCTQPTSYCLSSPCVNGTCREGGDTSDYTCDCQRGYTGRNCDEDIDECKIAGLCNQGICVNKPGGYECYCKPGYTGENCEVDFDECLSSPCKNNGTCVNKINNYECICMPGFTGKDCLYDINECESNPCSAGSTCINGLATFTCVCMEGLTGPTCEVNIDDCESSPCLNGGLCEDGLNSYTCNCSDTGHTGLRCETNIDDCASNPCTNGAQCVDGVKDYTCLCYPGYTGKNCETDILECESSPCHNRGVCLERSNISLYQNISYNPLNPVYIDEEFNMLLPLHFYQEFTYANASGFECICIPGIKGTNCEININECESSPCGPWGQCVDHVGRYECECEDGFEGDHCQRDIDECARYKPCVRGKCQDRRANYYCDCEPGWGGKNCSLPLQGCATNKCNNGGTCKPWLQDEIHHRFNCTCSYGYHGDTCEMITTMSLSGHSYVLVNTTREEGYDIQFRFKTTLGNGLLALGKGLTYYILELVNGRLNLHSSLLNKWEGVFIGSTLNDSDWHKVFVAINTSHLVLSANDEQTIYPININEGSNSSHTSFPMTYVGGVIPSLSRLAHGPAALIGCVEDVIINNEWVLPQMDETATDNPVSTGVMPVAISSGTASWLLHQVQATCPRVEQCDPNPCHSGGICTDLWTSFHCTCQRPFLGHTCQYNVTAATFGYENTTDSLVTVSVSDMARRAVRSILDISMFIRTRKPTGQIFYLGSKPRVGNTDETFVAASLVNGELIVRLKFNQTQEAYSVGGNNRLDNGFNHLIQIVRNQTLVQVKLNGKEYFRKSISATGQLDAQILYLGGVPLPVPSTRAVRQADVVPVPMLGATPSPTLPTDHFKGIIQDVQISNGSRTMIVEFFPLQVLELEMAPAFGEVTFVENTILKGVVSDDSCADNPCKHNGTCQVTWNDFRCECPRGYKGKSCQEMEFCQLQDCPVDSVCRNLDAGYECLANATMDGMSPPLLYAVQPGDAHIVAESITIMYRSKTGGTLLHIENAEGDMLSVSVYKDRVTVEWRQVPETLPRVWRFSKQTPDYQWNQIHLHMGDKYIRGGFSDWMQDDSPAFTADYNQQSWLDLLSSGDILLGGVHPPALSTASGGMTTVTPTGLSLDGARSLDDRTTYAMDRRLYRTTDQLSSSSNNLETSEFATESGLYEDMQTDFWNGSKGRIGENYKGCLGEVRLGNTLLAYFPLEELYPEPNLYSRQIIGLVTSKPTHGCSLCFSDDCLNGGQCEDPTKSFACSCPLGYSGEMCEINVDECEEAQCANNSTCLDGVGNYTCVCQPGWEGWLCDIDINECYSSPCENGGTCHDKPGGFVCECPEEVTGPRCSAPRLVTCQHHPCKRGSTCLSQKDEITGNNFTCKCVPGWEGVVCDVAYCIVKPCLNGGVCDSSSDMTPSCKCPPGFTGRYCETNIDDCRLPSGGSPCLNGGRCIDGVASYTCDCHDTGYEGVNCQNDINECEVPVSPCGDGGKCVNTVGSFVCHCNPGLCGPTCLVIDPCYETHLVTVVSDETTVSDSESDGSSGSNGSKATSKWVRGPCQNEGTCKQACTDVPSYECHCVDGWVGKNCTESLVATAIGDELPIGVIVGSVVGGLCALIGAGLVAACVLARTKRATRGTYSPSGQEYRNPRLEMLDNVLKPPPEERLI